MTISTRSFGSFSWESVAPQRSLPEPGIEQTRPCQLFPSKRTIMRKFFSALSITVVALLIAATLLGIIFLVGEMPSRPCVTTNAMWGVKRRILLYARQNDRLPPSLA